MNISNITKHITVGGEEPLKLHQHNSSDIDIRIANDIVQMNETLKPVIDYMLLAMLLTIMLSMGCEITPKQLWSHMKRPIGLTIGIISQFVLKPLAAYLVLLACGIGGLSATGVLIISCCPGGVLSNTFTFFSDGDLSLSVAMTTASTLMAMGMLPANIWIYGRGFESVSLIIPYEKMAVSLLIVTSPIAIGMLIRWKFPRVAKWTTKIGTTTGLLIMLASVVVEVIAFPNMFTSVPLKLYLIIMMLPILGLTLGYGISAIFRQSVPVSKTVAIECAVQNFPVALTIIALSFPTEMQEEIVLLPWLYGFAMISGCSILCAFYQLWKRIVARRLKKIKTTPAFLEGVNELEKNTEKGPSNAQMPLQNIQCQ